MLMTETLGQSLDEGGSRQDLAGIMGDHIPRSTQKLGLKFMMVG